MKHITHLAALSIVLLALLVLGITIGPAGIASALIVLGLAYMLVEAYRAWRDDQLLHDAILTDEIERRYWRRR